VGQSKSHLPRQGRLARLPRGRLVASPQDIGDHSKIEPGSPWALVLTFSEAAVEAYKSVKRAHRRGSTRPIESRTSVRATKKLGPIWAGSCVFGLARKADKGVYSLARFCCGSAQRVVGTRREVDHKQGTHSHLSVDQEDAAGLFRHGPQSRLGPGTRTCQSAVVRVLIVGQIRSSMVSKSVTLFRQQLTSSRSMFVEIAVTAER